MYYVLLAIGDGGNPKSKAINHGVTRGNTEKTRSDLSLSLVLVSK
jgi:hypothetical protein